jgi:hypothetical protein
MPITICARPGRRDVTRDAYRRRRISSLSLARREAARLSLPLSSPMNVTPRQLFLLSKPAVPHTRRNEPPVSSRTSRRCMPLPSQCGGSAWNATTRRSGWWPRASSPSREADRFVRPMDPRIELVYRLAIRAVCERCRSDREFRERTDALTARFGKELPDLLNEANRLVRS